MKRNILKYTLAGLCLSVGLASFSSCTDDFESTNTNPGGVPFVPVEKLFAQPIQSIYLNYENRNYEYQLQQNLNADMFSGYMATPTPFGGNNNNSLYSMVDGWNKWAYEIGYTNVMKPISDILKQTDGVTDYQAIAKIIRVAAMHRITDIYGPISYSQAISDRFDAVPYDSQPDVYNAFVKELQESVDALTLYVDEHGDDPSKNKINKFDTMCGSSYIRWIRFANSLRLRIAMRMSVVNPTEAKVIAEAAVSHKYGVLTDIDNNIEVVDKTLTNPLYEVTFGYDDIRAGASFISILEGLKDPRLSRLVLPVGWFTDKNGNPADIYSKGTEATPAVPTNSIGKYVGIRQGIPIPDKANYQMFSVINMPRTGASTSNPLPIMKVAEVYFLRAEGALRGWNMGGTVQDLYEKGILVSFLDAKVPNATTAYATYVADATNKPTNYVDPFDSKNNISAISTVTVKWNSGGAPEEKLEKIITQKWIAMYPEGQEAWSEFRRTGYPKLFPVKENRSDGIIPDGQFIKRLPFSIDEYATNEAEVKAAVGLLGGPDNANTRLWWDTGRNF